MVIYSTPISSKDKQMKQREMHRHEYYGSHKKRANNIQINKKTHAQNLCYFLAFLFILFRSEISQTYWKNLFTQKQIAEKMVRFQRNPRSGYKYTTCNYVGCLHILKTAEQERKHDKMHLRVIAKEQAASKKKSQKRKLYQTMQQQDITIGKKVVIS